MTAVDRPNPPHRGTLCRGQGLRILISEPNSFFAQDMMAGLQEAAPGAHLSSLPSLDSLRQQLVQISGTEVAPDASLAGEKLVHDRLVIIVSGALSEVRAAGLDQEIARLRGRLVMVQGNDSDAAVIAAGALILPAPFTPTALAGLVDNLLI